MAGRLRRGRARHGGGLVAALGVVLIAAQPARAVDFSGSLATSVCPQKVCIGEPGKPIDVTVGYKAGTLFGEPVVNTQIRWQPRSVAAHLPAIYSQADPSLLASRADGEAASMLRIYDTRVRLTIRRGNKTYTQETDAGIPGKPGKDVSYNVAGSPDWSRMLKGPDGKYVSAEEAKAVMKDGFRVANAEMVSTSVDTSRLETWWLDKNIDRYTDPLKGAIDKRLEALSEAFDLPVDELRAQVAAISGKGDGRAALAKLQAILDKLSPDRLPPKYLGTGPERLIRMKRYADAIRGSEEAFREAVKGLPPMPGTSEVYDNWYQQVQGRFARDAARLARLQGQQDEANRIEREAREAEARAQERRRQIAERKARAKKERERREHEEMQAQFDRGYDDYASAVRDSLGSSGWGWGASAGSTCGYGGYDIGNGQCHYYGSGSDTGPSESCVAQSTKTAVAGADVQGFCDWVEKQRRN